MSRKVGYELAKSYGLSKEQVAFIKRIVRIVYNTYKGFDKSDKSLTILKQGVELQFGNLNILAFYFDNDSSAHIYRYRSDKPNLWDYDTPMLLKGFTEKIIIDEITNVGLTNS